MADHKLGRYQQLVFINPRFADHRLHDGIGKVVDEPDFPDVLDAERKVIRRIVFQRHLFGMDNVFAAADVFFEVDGNFLGRAVAHVY